jgi:hypothetical protein
MACRIPKDYPLDRKRLYAATWKRLPWQQEHQIIDDTMKAISGITDPEKLVATYCLPAPPVDPEGCLFDWLTTGGGALAAKSAHARSAERRMRLD